MRTEPKQYLVKVTFANATQSTYDFDTKGEAEKQLTAFQRMSRIASVTLSHKIDGKYRIIKTV